jgi:hypothetical protein
LPLDEGVSDKSHNRESSNSDEVNKHHEGNGQHEAAVAAETGTEVEYPMQAAELAAAAE